MIELTDQFVKHAVESNQNMRVGFVGFRDKLKKLDGLAIAKPTAETLSELKDINQVGSLAEQVKPKDMKLGGDLDSEDLYAGVIRALKMLAESGANSKAIVVMTDASPINFDDKLSVTVQDTPTWKKVEDFNEADYVRDFQAGSKRHPTFEEVVRLAQSTPISTCYFSRTEQRIQLDNQWLTEQWNAAEVAQQKSFAKSRSHAKMLANATRGIAWSAQYEFVDLETGNQLVDEVRQNISSLIQSVIQNANPSTSEVVVRCSSQLAEKIGDSKGSFLHLRTRNALNARVVLESRNSEISFWLDSTQGFARLQWQEFVIPIEPEGWLDQKGRPVTENQLIDVLDALHAIRIESEYRGYGTLEFDYFILTNASWLGAKPVMLTNNKELP